MFVANVHGRLTTFAGGRPVDVHTASDGLFDADPTAVYRRWDDFRAWGDSIGAAGAPEAPPAGLGAPSPRPWQLFGIGLNYRDHAEESGQDIPDFPPTFTKFPTCIAGPTDAVELVSETTDWEVELVAVIGAPAHRVDASRGWRHVAGLTIGQDLSERTRQLAGPAPQFSLGKSFPGYGPTGPWLVTPDELADPDDLAVCCMLNGETVQESRTSQMIFSVPELVAHLSGVVPLQPGDLIFTGTPAGVGFARRPPRCLAAGDELVSEIDGIGVLTTSLIAGTAVAG